MKNLLGILYEHPQWFQPLFAELDKRSIPYEKIHAAKHSWNIAADTVPYAVVLNRLSSSSGERGNGQSLFHGKYYVQWLEEKGVKVINGSKATAIETSKAFQLSLFKQLGLNVPATFIVNHSSQLVEAAQNLRFPVMVKPNIGGAGSGITKFNDIASLETAIALDQIDFGIDNTVQVQEYIPAKGGHIHRVETLNGKFLYAMKVFTSGEQFNLCPAEICQLPEDNESICLTDAGKKGGLKVEAFQPSNEIIAAVEKIAAEAGLDVGGVEYLIDDRDGTHYFYDINALSNFVADAETVVGFDPYVKLVDYLETQLSHSTALI